MQFDCQIEMYFYNNCCSCKKIAFTALICIVFWTLDVAVTSLYSCSNHYAVVRSFQHQFHVLLQLQHKTCSCITFLTSEVCSICFLTFNICFLTLTAYILLQERLVFIEMWQSRVYINIYSICIYIYSVRTVTESRVYDNINVPW